MKVIHAAVFVCLGIWIAYTYPEFADTLYGYILSAIDWARSLLSSAKE
jgi:hypothetical protein